MSGDPVAVVPRGTLVLQVDSRSLLIGLAGLAALVLAMFADVLIAPGNRVLGNVGTDLGTQFLFWRKFGFRELANGNVALWNPHIFAGAPYFGGMQAALLYPVNWLFLVLPLSIAVNWSIAANVWLLGTFMFLWALRRGLHPLAAFTSAALLMFCGPHFLHIYAGHLTNLAAMVWAPLLFLAIDEWLRTGKASWCLAGMFAVAMQILAGHPQYVFYTAIAAGGYSLVRLVTENGGRLRAAAGLLTIHPGGALLAAAQLFAGVAATQETIRGRRLPYAFVTEFDFPPENILTLVAPGFFGNVQFYWGQGHLWEASLFFGVIGLALAAYGMVRGKAAGKTALLLMIPVTLVMALGDNTPLLRILYDYVPGFDRFRAISKFVFLTSLFLVLFAAIGLDRVIRSRALEPQALWTAAAAAGALGAGAWVVRLVDWQLVMLAIWSTGMGFLALPSFANAKLVAQAQEFASDGMLLAALTLGVAAGVALWLRFERRAVAWLAVLAVAEAFAFARVSRETFDIAEVVIPYFGNPVAHGPNDYRILNPTNPNGALYTGQFDIWGDDPGVTPRYAEFIFWSEGLKPENATQRIRFRRFHRLLSMVRLRYAAKGAVNASADVFETPLPPMSRLVLVGSHRVLEGRDAIFRAMDTESFDPRKEVILEKEPDPAPAPIPAATQGEAHILAEGTDFLEIEADVSSPSILLVTDAWSPSWRATALAGSSQAGYEVMPANYVLRGVPLAAGKHRLRLEYSPGAYAIGWWISAFAWLGWLACWIPAWRGPRRAQGACNA